MVASNLIPAVLWYQKTSLEFFFTRAYISLSSCVYCPHRDEHSGPFLSDHGELVGTRPSITVANDTKLRTFRIIALYFVQIGSSDIVVEHSNVRILSQIELDLLFIVHTP